MVIAPSILSANFANLEKDIHVVEAGKVSYLHVDVMDGHFVPNITFGPSVVAAIRKVTKLTLDCHLMIENPENLIPEFAKAGGDILTIHVESTRHIFRALQLIHDNGAKAGIVLNPGTSLEAIKPVLSLVDQVLVMTVNPGFGGQKFIPEMVKKVADLKQIRDAGGYQFDIEVDGGINDKTIKLCSDAGANVFVAGSYVYGVDDPVKQIKTLENAVK
ncbi:ribulose-phosphate 3-epimerase [Loigolactobacillus backii]|uniref:Ribulose-phosphate 3-epimerase n=1 Tax=Loigolactobacillus backii TaxID=375175 RepID=A0A192H190_9LACO|nr:ribulose-phosphate 3-epimerase [Loigolactobacillus backii]ANK62120.1 ribulose-phosphate 3-epimerase [Loigolactobacillus backii]ANK68685.1 ribulose-phosphate 3-epimerase [Loigolactobacillus backii]MDA5386688.1 ribulose-phosphate 3-epimerase [Loigolactobacillus backii]MDA5389213.1 ribulose-phosphate 3-epimerase [Loigolactobacillus backii]